MLNELEQKIRKAIPELNDLGVGCEIKYSSETIYIVSSMQKDFIYLISKDNISNRKMITIYDDRIEIIGKPIQLNHVLEYLSKLGYLRFVIDANGYICERDKGSYQSKEYLVRVEWNLKSNLLSEQSEELIKFINEL